MLLKFLKPGAHQEPGSINYIMKNPTALVLRGNPSITQLVIENSPHGMSQRFVSGVVNNLINLDSKYDELLLDELESMFLGGRPKSAMPWCAVQHTDKGKREIHFVVPFYDLLFGKWIHPYVDRTDRKTYQAWVECFAIRHNLDVPQDKLRKKPPFQHLRNIRKSDREFLKEVWKFVRAKVKRKTIKSREDLKYELIKKGHEVRFEKHTDGPLEQPIIVGPDGRQLRLTNSIYYRPDFGMPSSMPLNRKDKDACTARLLELNKIIKKWEEFHAFWLIGRLFGKGQQPKPDQRISKQILKRLIQERLPKKTSLNPNIQKMDFNRIFETCYHVKSDFPKFVIDACGKVTWQFGESEKAAGEPAGRDIKKIVETAPLSTNPEQTLQPMDAASEAFQPPVSDGITQPPCDSLVAPKPKPVVRNLVKKSRRKPCDHEIQ